MLVNSYNFSSSSFIKEITDSAGNTSTYNGNDVSFDTWLKEINDLVAKITNWRKDLQDRIFSEKYA